MSKQREELERARIEREEREGLAENVRLMMEEDEEGFVPVEDGFVMEDEEIELALDESDEVYAEAIAEKLEADAELDARRQSAREKRTAQGPAAAEKEAPEGETPRRREKSKKEKKTRCRGREIPPAQEEAGPHLYAQDLKKGKRLHRDILLVTYSFVILFLGMIGYLAWFMQTKSTGYAASEYNSKRQTVFADRYIRGDIRSADGKVLATTKIAEDGTETRRYPYGEMYAHVVGYSTHGSTGIESVAGQQLLSSGLSPIQTALDQLQGEKTQGDTVYTTLDSRMQETAWEALDGYRGAIVVMEVKTGRVLAMASNPGFDPNEIGEIWDELVSDPSNSNLVNRASQGLYPPGSTFKILTTLEYLRENPYTYTDFTFDCDSTYEKDDYVIRCSKGIEHGELDLVSAFARSCNGAYAVIGQSLDRAALFRLCETFGYNKDLDIGLMSNRSSYKLTEEGSLWEVLQTSIGQGVTQITPLHNCMIAAAIANDGRMMRPTVLDHTETASGTVVKTYGGSTFAANVMTTEEAELMTQFMRRVVTSGTGSAADLDEWPVAGKTGSAEWASGKDPHAWFVGFAPADEPEIAVSVLIESGGSGGGTAAPIAHDLFRTYFYEVRDGSGD